MDRWVDEWINKGIKGEKEGWKHITTNRIVTSGVNLKLVLRSSGPGLSMASF